MTQSAIRPRLTFVIQVHAMRVCITSDIQPVSRHLFAITLAIEIAINHSFVGIRALVVYECTGFSIVGGKPCEREGNASNQGAAIGFR